MRVMAARYSVSGQNPIDIAVAAISFCKDYKFDALVEGLDPVAAEKLLDRMTLDFRDIAVRTTVEMRTGSCLQKPGLFEGINDPIDRPSLKGK